MAENVAGRLFVEILGDPDKKQIEASIAAATKGIVVQLPTTLKLQDGAVREVIKETNAAFRAVKKKPVLNVGLSVTAADARKAITDANKRLKQSRVKPPRIKVGLDLDTRSAEITRKARASVNALEVTLSGNPIDIPVDLDEKSIARVSEKAAAAMAVIQGKIDAQMANREAISALRLDDLRDKDLVKHEAYLRDRANILDDHLRKENNKLVARGNNLDSIRAESLGKLQDRLDEQTRRGLDARSMAETRFQQRRILAHELADKRIANSNHSTLRLLRNDLSSFDASTTRTIRRTGFVFAGFTAGVVASFAAISFAALRSFGRTEVQIKRTAAVLGSGAFAKARAEGESGAQAWDRFADAVKNTEGRIRGAVEKTALATIFDPTEIAAGARALAQAGLEVEGINNSLRAVSQFAQNEELLPADAVANLVQGATAAGIALDKDTTAIRRLGDQFTFVANDTTATAKEMADAFANRAAPSFRAYGESVESTLTVLDLFARAGIKGKTAGEQVGILIREINKASTKTPATIAAFKKYGIQVGKVNGKNVDFLTTLSQLGRVLENVRKEKGSQGLARIRKELGLTEKSGAGLLQILPQVSRMGAKGLKQLRSEIRNSGGALEKQSSVISDTLLFQADRLSNQIGLLFKVAAGPTGRMLTGVFKKFGDQMEAGSGSAGLLATRIGKIGVSIRDRVAPAVKSLFFGVEGKNFFSGVFQMYKKFLLGLQQAFVEFRKNAFGGDDRRGFFTVLGQSLSKLGDFAAATLPRIGRLLGTVTRFVRENESSVRLMVKGWLSLFLANKALRLIIVPFDNIIKRIGSLRNAIIGVTGLKFADNIIGWAAGLNKYLIVTKSATVATNELAASQAAIAASQASVGAKTRRLGGSAGDAAAGGLIASGATQARTLTNISKISAALGGLAASSRLVISRLGVIGAIVSVGMKLASGAIQGFKDEWNRFTTDPKNRDNLSNFQVGMKFLADTVRLVGRLFRWVGGVISDEGKKWGVMFAQSIGLFVTAVGGVVRFVKASAGVIKDAFWSIVRSIGDAIARLLDMLADAAAVLARMPGGGAFANIADKLRSASKAADRFGENIKTASSKVRSNAPIIRKHLYDIRTQTWVLNRDWVRAKNSAIAFSRTTVNAAKRSANSILNMFPSATKAVRRLSAALRESVADRAADVASATVQAKYNDLLTSGSLTADSQMKILEEMGNAAATARLKTLGIITPLKRVGDAARNTGKHVRNIFTGGGDTPPPGGDTPVGDSVAKPIKEIKTAAEQATDAVNKLTQAQLNKQAATLVARVTRNAARGYKATAVEAEILKRVLPSVEAQLESQTSAVAKLDEALQALQGTQLAGTKQFSDQVFAIEQNIKQLQLQRLDLIIAGTPEEDSAIKTLDDQINKLQQQTERISLVESLQLDPLKRKLDETFNPVKELSFDQILKQFNQIQQQKAPLTQAIAGGENLKATLEATIKDAELRFGAAGRQVTIGFVNGIKNTTPMVTAAGKQSGQAALSGVNQVMQFGSPSRTMITRGIWTGEGFVAGINSQLNNVMNSGVSMMFSFLTGMRNVYMNRVQPFIHQITEWIKANKGPVTYDRTLLRPAGEAIMQGFHRGLSDGFSEIKTWVRAVGPHLANDTFPKELFIQRSARFLLNNVRADTSFNPQDAFGDLLFDSLSGIGGFDPALSFLHRTLSLADTEEMAKILAGSLPGGMVSALKYDHNKYTSSGNISDHYYGVAADISNGTAPTPGMNSLFSKLLPLIGTIFKQLIYKHVSARSDSGIGFYGASDHFNHIHAAWLKGDNFSLLSGRKGTGTLTIPGVAKEVLEAIAYASQATKLDPRLIAAVMKQESGFRKNVISGDGGYGLMQLTSAGLVNRADALGGRLNPRINALVGSEYLRDLINQLGSVRLGLSAYNSGPGGGERYGRVDVPAYVNSVLSFFEEFKRRFSGIGGYRAQGGKVNALTPYVVGERGRELFIPSTGGSVVSARDLNRLIDALGSMGTGNTGTVVNDNRNINISSNSNNADVVRALFDSRMRSQIVGVNR